MAGTKPEETAMGSTVDGSSPPDIQTNGPLGVEPRSTLEPGPLDEEIDFYLRHLEEWGQHEGQHVLIRGDQLHGFFDTRDDALSEGFDRFGRTSFLVKQVIRNEQPRWMGMVIF
jgi:hypothetical protein